MRTLSPCGFTLIETLTAVALVSILLTGSLASAYAIGATSARNDAVARIETEGRFIEARIVRMLQEARIAEPGPGEESALLLLEHEDGTRSVFARDAARLRVMQNGDSLSDVEVHALSFARDGAPGDAQDPDRLEFSFTLASPLANGPSVSREFKRTIHADAP